MLNEINKYTPQTQDRIFISLGLICVLFFSILQGFFSNVMTDAVGYIRESWTIADSLRRFEWFGNLPVALHGFIFKLPLSLIYLLLGKPSVIAAICVNVAYCLAIVPLSYYFFLKLIHSRLWTFCAVIMLVTSYNFILAEASFLREIPAMLATLILLNILIFKKSNLLLAGIALLLVFDAKEMNFYTYLPALFVFYLINHLKSSSKLTFSTIVSKILACIKGIRDFLFVTLPSLIWFILSITTSIIPNNPYNSQLLGLNKGTSFLGLALFDFGANIDVHKGGTKLSTIEGVIMNEDGHIARPPPEKFETISVSLWFKSDPSQGEYNKREYLYSLTDKNLWSIFTIYLVNGNLRVTCGVAPKIHGIYLESKEMLSDDKWHHVFVHLDPKDSLTLFVDGKLSQSVKCSQFNFGFKTTKNFVIGAFSNSVSDFYNFNGEIDEVYTWYNVLNMRLDHQAKTAARLYSGGKGLFLKKIGDQFLFNDQLLDTKKDYLVSAFKFETPNQYFTIAEYDVLFSRCIYAVNSPERVKGVDGYCAKFIKSEGQFFCWPRTDISSDVYKRKIETNLELKEGKLILKRSTKQASATPPIENKIVVEKSLIVAVENPQKLSSKQTQDDKKTQSGIPTNHPQMSTNANKQDQTNLKKTESASSTQTKIENFPHTPPLVDTQTPTQTIKIETPIPASQAKKAVNLTVTNSNIPKTDSKNIEISNLPSSSTQSTPSISQNKEQIEKANKVSSYDKKIIPTSIATPPSKVSAPKLIEEIRQPAVILASLSFNSSSIVLPSAIKPQSWKKSFGDGIKLVEIVDEFVGGKIEVSSGENELNVRLKITIAKITNIIIEILNRLYITFCKIFYPRSFSWLSFPKLVIVPGLIYSILFFRRCLKQRERLVYTVVPLIFWFYLFFFIARFNYGRYLLSISPFIFLFFVQYLRLGLKRPKFALKVILFTIPFIIGGFFFEIQYLPIKIFVNTFFIALLVSAFSAKKFKFKKFANFAIFVFAFLYCVFATGVALASSYTIGQIGKCLKYGYCAESDKIANLIPKNEKIWLGKDVNIDTFRLYWAGIVTTHKTGQELKDWLPKKEKLGGKNSALIYTYHWEPDRINYFLDDCSKRNIKRIVFVVSKIKKNNAPPSILEKQLEAVSKHPKAKLEFKTEMKNKTVYSFKVL